MVESPAKPTTEPTKFLPDKRTRLSCPASRNRKRTASQRTQPFGILHVSYQSKCEQGLAFSIWRPATCSADAWRKPHACMALSKL
eukprot:5442139-Amphidinium_carterae.1